MRVIAEQSSKPEKKQPFWLITVGVVLAGILLLADAFGLLYLHKVTAQLGVALLFSAFALLVGKGRWPGYTAVAIIWLAVVAMFFY